MINFKKLILITVFISFYSSNIFAQVSNIIGKVTDAKTNESIEAALVEIKGLQFKTATDSNGNYRFKNVPAGKIEIKVSYLSYEQETLMIDVPPGQILEVDIQLRSSSIELEGVVVSFSRFKAGSVNSVISEARSAKAVVSGISKQQIALSQDNNAAQVVQRVPGITIIENRFVMIRGLNERYNNVLINNVVAPSTEVDRRTFSFDLIPSNSIDRMMIFKSGSPENPGDFAGGVIKVFTNNVVEEPFTELSFSTGVRPGTTFQPYLQSKGGNLDFLGFDDGYRLLPQSFPSSKDLINSTRPSTIRQTAGRQLSNNWVVNQTNAIPDFKFGLNLGRKFTIAKKDVSMITSFDVSQSFQNYTRDFFRYFEYDDARPDQLDKRFSYLDNIYEKQNRISLMSNWSLALNGRNKIKFSNLFNQIGENETNLRQGEDFIQTLGFRRHYALSYRSRSIYTGQLDGTHQLSDRKNLKWVLGGSFLSENEPDFRRFRTYAPNGNESTPNDQFRIITPPSSNLFDASRYFGKLSEISLSHGLDYSWTWKETKGGIREVKLGYYLDYRDRTFDSRYMSFLIPGNVGFQRKSELEGLPLKDIFSKDNITTTDGFILEEGTRPQDSYTASNFLNAGYLSVVYPINNLTVSGGLRAENNIQQLNSFRNLSTVQVNNPIFSVLPFANFTLKTSEKNQIRLGYGKTINRPEFRELAPFNFYDYKFDANRVGEPGLRNSTIDNIDLRFEFYPRLSESVSIGAFYKYFNDPIENRGIITTELPTFTYVNADFANNYGVEIELRKSLDQMFNSSFLKKLQFNLNAAYIISQVDLGSIASAQQRVRPLQGQSPYIVNAIMSYNDLNKKLIFSTAYNIFGPRIYIVGDLNNPDIYELPRHSLDVTLTKSFNSFSLKMGIQDLLNYKYRFTQDTNRNGKINDSLDANVFSFNRGSLFNTSIVFKINKNNNY
jgi:hypothetical protein